MQAAGVDAGSHRARREAHLPQLSQPHDPVLPRRKRRDRRVDRGVWCETTSMSSF
jgi:hypothetical protein